MFTSPLLMAEKDLFENQLNSGAHAQYEIFLNGQWLQFGLSFNNSNEKGVWVYTSLVNTIKTSSVGR